MEKIVGKIVEGQKRGRLLGFPTINLPYFGEESGVFVGRVLVNDEEFRAAVHLGPRPTFELEEKICEAFLLDFEGEFFSDGEVIVELLQKIRPIKKFDDAAALALQIKDDVRFVENWYNARK